MRILVALDPNPYSRYILKPAAELAANTWAQVTFLGVEDSRSLRQMPPAGPVAAAGLIQKTAAKLDSYRKIFLDYFQEADTPYGRYASDYQLSSDGKDALSLVYPEENGHRRLDTRIRLGNAGKEILAEAEAVAADLILIGCSPGTGCHWMNDEKVAEKLVKTAGCSVFVIKEDKTPRMIDCCIDQDNVSQASIELINQLVTLYKADLEIVGVAGADGLETDVERRMAHILEYYTLRDIKAWIKVVEGASLPAFVNLAAEKNLVALWLGKTSLLDRLFSKQHLGRLVSTAVSSILILR